jgi:hypothetical protein
MQAYPDPTLGTWRGRWAQIAMGILVNFAADGAPAENLVEKAVLEVMKSAHLRKDLLTLHAHFTAECAQCLHALLRSRLAHIGASVSTHQVLFATTFRFPASHKSCVAPPCPLIFAGMHAAATREAVARQGLDHMLKYSSPCRHLAI